jgi:hypothetical protein
MHNKTLCARAVYHILNIHIPIKITADINAAQEWFVTNQDLFLQETNKQFITHI